MPKIDRNQKKKLHHLNYKTFFCGSKTGHTCQLGKHLKTVIKLGKKKKKICKKNFLGINSIL